MNSKKSIRLVYRILHLDPVGEDYESSMGSVSIIVYEVDENSNILNIIGNFNFKIYTSDETELDEFIHEKLKEMVLFKLKKQENIDNKFFSIIKSFNYRT